jgi:SAM-dependent methyltransferase
MGLGPPLLHEIIELKRSGALTGMTKVVEIGAQQLSNEFLRAQRLLKEACDLFERPDNLNLGTSIYAGYAGGLELQAQDAPASQPFWEALGFTYATIDFDGHRHSFAMDLNRDRVPRAWRNNFDLCINAGTTEHVANQDNAFRVMHDLVRTGGIMIHDLPAAGMLTHGLVTYTMKFFWHLCRENNYEVLRLEMTPGGTASLSDDIIATNNQFGRRGEGAEFQAEAIRDWAIVASLRKVRNATYVTPLDVPPEVMPEVGQTVRSRWKKLWKNRRSG